MAGAASDRALIRRRQGQRFFERQRRGSVNGRGIVGGGDVGKHRRRGVAVVSVVCGSSAGGRFDNIALMCASRPPICS